MTPLEIAFGVINGIALPLLLWRAKASAELAAKVAEHSIEIAVLRAKGETVESLKNEIVELRADVKELVRTLAGIEAKLETRLLAD